jgi:single-stranded-DNA-specific exonuclease
MHWREPPEISVPDELRAAVGGHPMIARRLARQGILSPAEALAFLDPRNYQPASPFDLPDMDRASARLKEAIERREQILIWGDFDVDGQTATALLYSGLSRIGASVEYHMPRREGEGHGINLPKLQHWLERGIDLMITCDTGTTAFEGVDRAQSAGIDVIVTDHHIAAETLPAAHSVINPQRLPAAHPLRDLPGSGVAFQLLRAVAGDASVHDQLDLVALGIVADVAVQARDTRYLLQLGLETMRATVRPGLLALMERAEIAQLHLTESDIGFRMAPRLNAQGRMSDARACVELLSTTDVARAVALADELEAVNARRKLESRLVEDSANSLIEKDPSLLSYSAIVLSHPEWTGGVSGIVANRLAETWHKPVVLLCERGEIAFGSARSVAGCNIMEALGTVKDILGRFGGHQAAAGLSMRRESIFEFRRRLSRAVREQIDAAVEEPELEIDDYITLGEATMELAEDIGRLAPFGRGNRALTLAIRNLKVARRRKLGRTGDHLELLVEDEAKRRGRVLWWNAGDIEFDEARIDLACTLRKSRFKGETEVLLEPIDVRRHEMLAAIEVQTPSRETIDWRGSDDPHARLAEALIAYPEALVWRERSNEIEGVPRTELKRAETLIIWTAPPGPDELEEALKRVKPKRLVLFECDPGVQSLEEFLRRLGGMLKYAEKTRSGPPPVAEIAAALGEREATVRYGIEWFTSRESQLESLIRASLAETAAYRKGRVTTEHTERDTEKHGINS